MTLQEALAKLNNPTQYTAAELKEAIEVVKIKMFMR